MAKAESYHVSGLLLLTAMCLGFTFYAVQGHRDEIREDLLKRVSQEAQKKGLMTDWASLTVEGRDVIISGIAPTRKARAELIESATNTEGVNSVSTLAEVAPAVTPFTWSAMTDGKELSIDGYVPTMADARAIREEIKRLGFTQKINDRTRIADGVNSQNWREAVFFALNGLIHLTKGETSLSDNLIQLNGVTRTDSEYRKLLELYSNPIGGPDNYFILGQLTAPWSETFHFEAHRDEVEIKLKGLVPDDVSRLLLMETLGSTVGLPHQIHGEDLQFASGFLGDWPGFIEFSRIVLTNLSHGTIIVNGDRIDVTGVAACADCRARLEALAPPKDFTLMVNISDKPEN